MIDLDEHRKNWRNTISGDGGHCPVCDRWGKIYSRPINKTMALSVLWLAKKQKEQFLRGDDPEWVNVPVHGPHWLVRSNQLPTMRWWNMVERLSNEDPARKHSGMWRCTSAGVAFALNGAAVPAKVFTYNDAVEGYSTELTTFSDCIEDFDYSEIMSVSFRP